MTMIGRYEPAGTLGEGGFATVYRAWDAVLGRQVALKELMPHLAARPDLHARFLAEARALAALRHPNIVSFYDVGEANGRPFFVMELIEAGSSFDRANLRVRSGRSFRGRIAGRPALSQIRAQEL